MSDYILYYAVICLSKHEFEEIVKVCLTDHDNSIHINPSNYFESTQKLTGKKFEGYIKSSAVSRIEEQSGYSSEFSSNVREIVNRIRRRTE